MGKRGGWVYMMTNPAKTVIYTGVTNDLARRSYEHEQGGGGAFTRKYNCKILVYAEWFDDIRDAINEEKRIKAGSRKKKIALIEENNPKWLSLWDL